MTQLEKKSADEVLAMGVLFERKVAELYRLFYRKFVDDDLATHTWYLLVLEEESHASYLESERQMLNAAPEAFGGPRFDVTILQDTLNAVDGMLERVRTDDIDLEGAVRMAMDLEDGAVETEYFGLVDVASEGLKKVLDSVLIDSRQHRNHIKALAKEKGIDLPES